MTIAFALFFGLLAGAPVSYVVVDENRVPVAGATVVFHDSRGADDPEVASAGGTVHARDGFDAHSATVAAPGFLTEQIAVDERLRQIVLHRTLPLVGTVSVATGSSSSLHRLPLAASVLDRAALANAPVQTTDAALRELAGFDRTRSNSAFTNYGQLRASFSGAGNDRGTVLVDGIPAQDGFGGQIDWLAYTPASLDRAELLRGAGSALYGSGAIGGVLDITTVSPANPAAPAGGRFIAGVGTNALIDDSLIARVPLGGHFAASLAAGVQRLAYLDLPPAYAAPIDLPAVSTSNSSNLKFRYSGGATNVELSALDTSDQQQEGRPSYTFARTMQQYALVANHVGGPLLEKLVLYQRDATVDNGSDQFPTAPGILRYVQHVPTTEDGVALTLLLQNAHGDLALRADDRHVAGSSLQTGSGGTLQAFGSGNQTLRGFALQQTLRAGHFEALFGARVDEVAFDDGTTTQPGKTGDTTTAIAARDDSAVSPRVALRYDLSPALALRASSGGGFRAPYLNELLRGFQIGQTVYLPNSSLVPERSRTDGAGLDVLFARSRLSFDLSSTHVRDAIAFVTIGDNLVKRENVEGTQTDGATATYARSLGTCARLRASGTTQYARVTAGPAASLAKRLQLIPNRSLSVGIDAVGGALTYGIDGAYVGQTYNDDLNAQPLGAALLFDAQATATLHAGTTLSLGIVNATHQQYLSSIDRYGPPLGVAFRIGIPLGAVTPITKGCGALP